MVMPGFASLLLATPASAQVQTSRIAVLNFQNLTKTPDDMITTMCRDAVVVELLGTAKYDVTTSETLQTTMEKLGFRGKNERASRISLTKSMMQRLGQELGVNGVMDGDLVSIRVDRAKKLATVRLAIRVLDVTSGEWTNGAVATGESHPRIGYSGNQDTDWVLEAVNDAAHNAVQAMVNHIMPEAFVLHSLSTSSVLLNHGSQDGIVQGMSFLVLRTGENGSDELVARLKIASVNEGDAIADVTWQARGVKPQDRAKSIYDPPTNYNEDNTPETRLANNAKLQKGQGMLYAVALGLGLWILMGRGGQTPEGAMGCTAMAGGSPNVPADSPLDGSGQGGILIAWNNPKGMLVSQLTTPVITFDVIRNSVVGPAMPYYATPAPPLVTGLYDHATVDTTSDTTGGDTAIIQGVTYTYYVQCTYPQVSQGSGGTGLSLGTLITTSPTFAGRATWIRPPVLTSPGGLTPTAIIDLSNVTFQWQASTGANQYVIEVSTDQSFTRSKTWVSGPLSMAGSTGGMLQKQFVNVLSTASELAGLAQNTQVWWRVGGRNSSDTPGPVPDGFGASVANGGAKSTKYIYTPSSPGVYTFLATGAGPLPPVNPSSTGARKKK